MQWHLRMLGKGLVCKERSIFKNVGERYTAKSCCLVSFLSMDSKVFEKLVSNRFVGHPGKCGLFSDFQYGFRFSWSTVDLLTVVSKECLTFQQVWGYSSFGI